MVWICKFVLLSRFGADARNEGGENDKKEAMGFELSPEMMAMMGGFTVLRFFTLMGGMMNIKLAKDDLLELNAKLNKIEKAERA